MDLIFLFCGRAYLEPARYSDQDLLKNQKKIKFSGAGASHQNGEAECAIKTILTMSRTTLMHADLRCPEYTLYTDLWPIVMDYAVWIYNWIPGMQSGLYDIEIWSRSRFETVSETLSNYTFWGCTTYLFKPNLQKS